MYSSGGWTLIQRHIFFCKISVNICATFNGNQPISLCCILSGPLDMMPRSITCSFFTSPAFKFDVVRRKFTSRHDLNVTKSSKSSFDLRSTRQRKHLWPGSGGCSSSFVRPGCEWLFSALCVRFFPLGSAFNSAGLANLKLLPVAQSHPAEKAEWRDRSEYDHSVFKDLCPPRPGAVLIGWKP